MKRILVVSAAFLLAVSSSVQAQEEAEGPPDPTPGATKPVREQNLDVNDWIAVHEQGTADVKIVNDEAIEVNVTGGSIEAEITGGQVEVTNEVTVKFPVDEVIEVDVVSSEYRKIPSRVSIWIDPGDGYGFRSHNPGFFHVESSTCVAESAFLGINDSFYIAFYNITQPADSLAEAKFFPLYDVCIPFTRGYDTGSLDLKYEYICKSNSPWTAKYGFIYAVIEGNGNTPVDEVLCTLNGYSIPD